MIDFSEYVQNHPSFRAYGGANGIKKGIIFRNEPYMLKIEHRNKKINILIVYYLNILHLKFFLCLILKHKKLF